MNFEGTYQIDRAPAQVWEELNTVDALKSCIPGCEELEQVSPTEYNAVVRLKIGPIKARFSGSAAMTKQTPPNSCVIEFQGNGGIAGMAKGTAEVTLKDANDGTELNYLADVVIGGKVAQIGARLLKNSAKSIADKFFAAFAVYEKR